jgi:hypothetical protein
MDRDGDQNKTDLLGHQRDMHGKEACLSTASKSMDDGRHGTTVNAGVYPLNPHIPGDHVSMLITQLSELDPYL